MLPYVTLNKELGKTPLEALTAYKAVHPELRDVPMAYAGRLDPMAEGLLLVLLGDECKVQERYHAYDKEYVFEILFGMRSDTGDILGLTASCTQGPFTANDIKTVLGELQGAITLPYPHFSSKTVQGKPLHMWKLEGRIDEIEIPTKESMIHKLDLLSLRTIDGASLRSSVHERIALVSKVTDPKKSLGKDFRREDVLALWDTHLASTAQEEFVIAQVRCIASSGTYMRSLAEVIASKLHTCGLAYSIRRTRIGTYARLPFGLGYWRKQL
jgi:tRNA pseudouridine(55) synthase